MIPLAALPLIALLWDFDRSAEPTPFLVIVESIEVVTGMQRLLVAGVADGICAEFPGADSATWCTTMTCPGPGTFRLTVEAVRYQTRSNTIRIRVLDPACTRLEGVTLGPGPYERVPPAAHCRPATPVTMPPVGVALPATDTTSVPIPQPRTTAPVIPAHPQVVAKKPHAPGTVPGPTGTYQPPPPRQARDTQPLTVTLRTGPPPTVTVQPPPVTVSGVVCPP